jgi:hypothetical protein
MNIEKEAKTSIDKRTLIYYTNLVYSYNSNIWSIYIVGIYSKQTRTIIILTLLKQPYYIYTRFIAILKRLY